MSILSEIGAWLMGIGEGTLSFVKNALIALAQNPQIQAIAQQEVQNVEDAAVTAIQSGNVVTGAEKFAQAQTGVIKQITDAGLPVVMNQVNLAIESAVANLQAGS